MQKKLNPLLLILGLISMIITGYALYVTVFNQIIAQNEGFFYAIVFGGILVLVYIFVNVGSKLLHISDEARDSRLLKVICLCVVLILVALFCYSRVIYTSTVNPSEASFYNSAKLLLNDSLLTSSDMSNKLLKNPVNFVQMYLYSFLLSLGLEVDNLIIIVNTVLCGISAIFIYFIMAKITDRICAVIAAFLSLFLPNQMFSVFSYNSDIFLSVLFFGCILFGLNIALCKKKALVVILNSILYFMFASLLMFSEPTLVIFILLFPIGMLFLKNGNSKLLLLLSVISIALTFGLLYYKCLVLDKSIGQILTIEIQCFSFKLNSSTNNYFSLSEVKKLFDSYIGADSRYIEQNYQFIVKHKSHEINNLVAAWAALGNQLFFMFVLVLSMSGIFSVLQNKDSFAMPAFVIVISTSLQIFFSVGREVNSYNYHSAMAMLAAIGFFYIYLNHHKESVEAIDRLRRGESATTNSIDNASEVFDEESQIEHEDFLVRANALVFVDGNDNLYSYIRSDERRKFWESHKQTDTHEFPDDIDVTRVFFDDDLVEPVPMTFGQEDPQTVINPVNYAEPVYADELHDDLAGSSNDNNASHVEIISETPDNSQYESIPVDDQNVDVVDLSSEIISPIPVNFNEDKQSDENAGAVDEASQPVTYIPNPLPVPVRRPHASIDFDYDINDDSDWDYDSDDDDFDV